MDFISILSIFVLACFVGYYVVWSVTPALHTPLMSVTNAISSVIVVGALIAAAASLQSSVPREATQVVDRMPCITAGRDAEVRLTPPANCDGLIGTAVDGKQEKGGWSHWLGLIALALASVNIFGGFAVTQRMLAMYKKKERKDA